MASLIFSTSFCSLPHDPRIWSNLSFPRRSRTTIVADKCRSQRLSVLVSVSLAGIMAIAVYFSALSVSHSQFLKALRSQQEAQQTSRQTATWLQTVREGALSKFFSPASRTMFGLSFAYRIRPTTSGRRSLWQMVDNFCHELYSCHDVCANSWIFNCRIFVQENDLEVGWSRVAELVILSDF